MGIRVRNWEVLHCMRFTLSGISFSGIRILAFFSFSFLVRVVRDYRRRFFPYRFLTPWY
jgi:hypothetical protein